MDLLNLVRPRPIIEESIHAGISRACSKPEAPAVVPSF